MSAQNWMILASVLLGLTAALCAGLLTATIDWFNRWYSRDLRARGDRLGLSANLNWLRWWWGGVLAVALIIGLGLKMPIVAALVTILLGITPRTILALLADRRGMLLRNQMVAAARALSSQFRAGLSLAEGLRNIARDTPKPLSSELRRCVDEYDTGTTLFDTLTTMKNRLDIDAITLFVVALLACERRGGKVTDAMDTISQSLEELQRIDQKKESVTASGRVLVIILSLFPAIFAGLYAFIDPKSLVLLFTTVPGQFVVCMVILLTYFSVRWASRIIAAVD